MKRSISSNCLRLFAGMALVAAVLVLGGCLQKRIVWSPDGRRAAVLSSDGLRFCGADGVLDGAVIPDVYNVAWLSDSQRLLVARERRAANWEEVAGLLGPERSAQIAADAESVLGKFRDGAPWGVVAMDVGGKNPYLRYFLRERHGGELRERLDAGEWDEVARLEIKVHEALVMGPREGRFEAGAPFYAGLETVYDLRVGAGEKAVAISLVVGSGPEDRFRLVVAPLDGSVSPVEVASDVAAFPDWTADGRELVYLQSAGTVRGDQVQFGVFQQREALAADGSISLAEKAVDLGGAIFQPYCRLRCLADGRIIFNATELTLPVAARDLENDREQLFALDPSRQATLVRLTTRNGSASLPKMLAFFEPSADGKTLLFGGVDGEACVLTLATGEVARIQDDKGDGQTCMPAWREPGAFTYLKRAEPQDGRDPKRKFEVVLRRGDEETVLSSTWPDEVLAGLTK